MKRTITGVLAGAALLFGLTACTGGETTSWDDASPEVKTYASSYCELEASLAGRRDFGSQFDRCLDKAAVERAKELAR